MPPIPPVESILRTHDGLSLVAAHHLRPACRARIAILHGYAEHMGRYSGLVAALGEAGFECHLLDLRGHGRSEGVRGYVPQFADYLDDLDLFLDRVEEVSAGNGARGTPRFLFGHSLGGLIALAFVLRRPETFGALAAASPFLHPAVEVSWLRVAAAAVASRLAPTHLAPSDLDSRGLSHDPAVVAGYDADPLVFKTLNAHWFFEVRREQREVFEQAGAVRLPVLFLLGGADPIADPGRSEACFARLGSADKRLRVYPGLLHEVLNEPQRDRVVADLLTWLGERAPLPAPAPPAAPRPAR